MWRRRWPTTTAPVLVVIGMLLSSLVPGTLTAPSEDLSLEDTVRVLRHFSAGVGARRGASSGRHLTGHSHGNLRGQQSLQVRLESLEVHDDSKEVPSRPGQHEGNHRDDLLSLERESLEVTLGSSAVPAGGTPGTHGFSSQYFVVGDDDLSIEIDEDDFRYMNLGRRYHPDGIAPTSPQQLFIPQPATVPGSMGRTAVGLAPSLNNPFIIATASSSEENYEDNPYEDDDDDEGLAIYLSKNLLRVKGDDSSEERFELDDALLGKRYNYIDGQGSARWGYDLVDQYQHQTINTDGTMKGRFGWTAPNGQEIKVQYVADDGGYRLVGTSGIHPMDSEDVRQLKIEHSEIHKKVASRRPVSPIPPHASVGVPLPPIDKSYKVTIPFGGAGVPLPDQQSGISPFHGSPGFTVGVPLPPQHGAPSGGTVGVPLPPQQGAPRGGIAGVPLPTHTEIGTGGVPLSIPSRQPTGGVPLPRPSGPGAIPSGPGFFGDDETVVVGASRGVALPGMSAAEGGGVPLPSPTGPGAVPSGSGFFGDDETVVVGADSGVPLPGMPGVGTSGVSLSRPATPATSGVHLPSPSGPGEAPSGTGFFGGETVVFKGASGVGLPGMSGVDTGGVPLSIPSGPGASPSEPSFFGDDDTVVAGVGAGVGLPGISVVKSGGVPLPSPSGPEATPSGPGFLGDDDTVVVGVSGGVGLPGLSGAGTSGISPSKPGGVPLPSPSGTEAAPSGPGFFGDDETVVVGASGGVGLPGMSGVGTSDVSLSKPAGPTTGGMPLPIPSSPGPTPSGPGFFGDDETIVVGASGGVGLPGTSAAGPEATPSGPGFLGDDTVVVGADSGIALPGIPEVGTSGVSLSRPAGPATVGVSLPSPSGSGAAPSGTGVFGDDETVVFKGVSGVGLPGVTGAGAGGVPLPSPSGPETPPSGPGFFGDDTVVAGAGGDVGLPGTSVVGSSGIFLSSPAGTETGGVSLPSPSGPGATPIDDTAAGSSSFDDATIDISVSEPGLGTSGPGLGAGVSIPGLGLFDDASAGRPGFDDVTTGFGASGALGPGFGAGVGVSLPSFGSTDGDAAGRPGFDDATTGFGASGPGLEASGPDFGAGAGVPLPSFGTADDDAAGRPGFDDASTRLDASGPGLGASGSGFGAGAGVSLPSFGSTDDDAAAVPGFDDATTGFGASGPGLGASGFDFGAGTGVSLPGFGSTDDDTAGRPGFDDITTELGTSGPGLGASGPGFGAGTGVSLPSFGSTDEDAAGRPGFHSTTLLGASGPEVGASGPGFGAGAGVPLPGFGSTDAGAAGGPGFHSTTVFGASGPGLGASGPGFDAGAGVSLSGFGSTDDDAGGRQGFDDATTGLGLSKPGFNGGGVPLSFGFSENTRPVKPGLNGPTGEFGFAGSVGSSDDFGQGLRGPVSKGGVPLNSGFGGSARFSGAPGIAPTEFGRGALDASEVPLQGPPVPGTFSITANLGQGGGSPGVPLNTASDMSFNKIHNSNGFSPFFEVGPPEPVNHAAGGPTNASPFPPHPHTTILDSHRPNQIHLPSGPVREPGPLAESSANLASESDKPQDLVKVYHDIYGIKMRLEDWAAPRRREAPPANLELPGP